MRWRVRRPGSDLNSLGMRLVYDGGGHRTPAARANSGGATRAAAGRLARDGSFGDDRRLHAAGELAAFTDREREDIASLDARRLERGAMRIPDRARGAARGLGKLRSGDRAEELADVVDHLGLQGLTEWRAS